MRVGSHPRGGHTDAVLLSTRGHAPERVREVLQHGGQGATNDPDELVGVVVAAIRRPGARFQERSGDGFDWPGPTLSQPTDSHALRICAAHESASPARGRTRTATGRPSYKTEHSQPLGTNRSTHVRRRSERPKVQRMSWLGFSMRRTDLPRRCQRNRAVRPAIAFGSAFH
jgi:hypothetical protein